MTDNVKKDRENGYKYQALYAYRLRFDFGGKGEVLSYLDGKEFTVPADCVLVSIGRRANTAGIGLENIGVLLERGAVVTDECMRTNIPGVYAAGDIRVKSLRQVVTAAADGAIAAMQAEKYLAEME